MARTKQTPRNPVLERLPTAVGSNIQGKKMPSKPTPKKAIKGGSNPTNICYTKLPVESKSHIDIILDC